MNELISHEAVCKTTPDTQGLLIPLGENLIQEQGPIYLGSHADMEFVTNFTWTEVCGKEFIQKQSMKWVLFCK